MMKDISNLPPTVLPMMPPSEMVFHVDYVFKSTVHPNDKELRHYIMTTSADMNDQKEWTEKTIRTREKLRKLQNQIFLSLPNYHGKLSPIDIVSYMVDSVKVSEFLGKIIVTMLSPKGVEWCNAILNELKDLEHDESIYGSESD